MSVSILKQLCSLDNHDEKKRNVQISDALPARRLCLNGLYVLYIILQVHCVSSVHSVTPSREPINQL